MTTAALTRRADDISARTEASRRFSLDAGAIALAYFEQRTGLTIERKSGLQDLVSEADREVERAIRTAIAAEFPDDALIGEEHGSAAGRSGFTWVVDPIDGTVPFLTGQPNWCVSIAVTDPDGIVAGAIHAPVLRETFEARRGGGAFLNGRQLVIDEAASIRSGTTALGATQTADPDETGRFVAELYRRGGVLFRIGSGALMLGYVAAGRISGYFDPRINAWDCYAGILIIQEAGGVVVFKGDTSAPGPLWSGNAAMVESLIEITGADGRTPAHPG